jgi:hypothetical protein
MITQLTLRNFKSVQEEHYDFTAFDLLVGWNNSGKSTVLQALAIWQYCVDEFRRSKRVGKTGIQVILPNFTALPVPAFNLLWRNKVDRQYPEVDGKREQKFILINIEAAWRAKDGQEHLFGVNLRYQSAQTIYAIPQQGWDAFRKLDQDPGLPVIAYVPPFSGLEPHEEHRDDAPLRRQVGKAQPGSVLRNLLWRVCPSPTGAAKKQGTPADWQEIRNVVKRWFSVDLLDPLYEEGKDTQITCEYRQARETFDLIAGGSGFHQALTLLAFLYGYHPNTILLDEPDAHLHVNLQREILDYFKNKAQERKVQFLIATHAEEFVRGVNSQQIVSLLAQKPNRVPSTPAVLRAMADLSNMEVTRLRESPVIVYVEGESDERILRAWAPRVAAEEWMPKLVFSTMDGGSKKDMRDSTDRHFEALRQVLPHVRRVMVFDFDTERTAFHPEANNPTLFEWSRKNIENYLLVADAWRRTVLDDPAFSLGEIFARQATEVVQRFFVNQNLTLPPERTWRDVSANVFQVVDGKRILFENQDALFQQLKQIDATLLLSREKVAGAMKTEELHTDVLALFEKLKNAVNESPIIPQ